MVEEEMEMEVVESPPLALLRDCSTDVEWEWGGRENPKKEGSLPKSRPLLPTMGVGPPEAQGCLLWEEEEEEGVVWGP